MTNLIDDETASRYWQERDTAPEAERESRNAALMEWATAKKAEQRRTQRDEVESGYMDFEGWWGTTGADAAMFNGDEDRQEILNRRYIAHQFDQTPDEQGQYYPTYRDQFLQQTFGKSGLSEAETFNLIKGAVESKKATEGAINNIPGDVAMALWDNIGTGAPVNPAKVLETWKQKNADQLAGLPENWESKTLAEVGKYISDTEQMLRDHAEPLKKVYDHFAAVTGRGVENAGESQPKNLEEMQALVDTLAGMPQPVRDRALASVYMAAENSGMDAKSVLQQFGESWSRTLNRVRTTALVAEEYDTTQRLKMLRDTEGLAELYKNKTDQGPKVVTGATAAFSPQDYEPLAPDERTAFAAEAEKELARFQVYRELQNIADNKFDPIQKIKGNATPDFVEAILYGTPDALATSAMAAIPVVGLPLTVGTIYADEYNQLRLQGIDAENAQGIAAYSAGLQTVPEVLGAKLIFGQLPWFENLLRKYANPARFGRGSQFAMRYAAGIAGENLTEGIQDLATPVVQDIFAAFRSEVPDVDWDTTWKDWRNARPDVFAATLVPVMVGTGMASMADSDRFSSYEYRLSELYKPLGLSEEKIKLIEDGGTPQEMQTRLVEQVTSISSEEIKSGIAYQEQRLNEAKAEQEDVTKPTLVRETAPDGSQQFVVRDGSGQAVYTSKDYTAASQALIETRREQVAADLEGTRTIIRDRVNHWLSQNPANTLIEETQGLNAQQKLEQLQAAGNVAQIEELHNRITNSPFKDTPYDQINILGEASVQDVAEMVFKPLITINPNTRPENLREEIHHIGVKIALKNGRVTLDTLRGWLDATEKALPGTFQNLVRETEGDIIESLAQVQAAYEDGKINANEETQLPASFVDYMKRMMRAFAEVLRRAVALRGAFKDGALPAEYESFLAESTGLNQQTLVDTTRERVGNEVLTDTNYSIGSKPYPMEDKGKWYSNEDFAKRGGRIVAMSPDQFLSQVRPLEVDDASRDNIDDLKNMMQSGRKLDPLTIYADGKEDGRHRAIAAKELGIASIPVIDFRQPVSTDTNFSIGNVSRVDEKGIHPFAKPRPSTYANPNESEFDPSAILETLVRGKTGADSTKRRKHGRTLASFSKIVDWAEGQGRTIDPSIFAERKELGSGGEHLVFQAEGGRVYKLTKPGLFGIQADDAGAYLQRWALANRLFNDDARIEGIVKLPGESDYRTVVSHRHIDGRDSTRAEIQDYLQSHGFVQVESQWIHPTLGIAALDAETAGNSITMPDGTVAPVDLNLQPASPQYLQEARKQTGLGGQTNFSIGLSRNSISQVSDKDDPFRVGTAKLGTSKVPKNTPQDSNISGDNIPDDLLAKQMEKMNYAHLPKNILSEKDPKKKRRKLINWFKKNLLALHDAFPEEFRARATHWYDGANRIAKEMGSQFKASVEQASGVIAVFSPQKDWFMNVAQAEQFMELWTNSQDVVLEESLVRAEIEGIIEAATVSDKQKRKKVPGETKEQTAERREYNKALDKLEKEKRRKIVEQVIGKTISDLDSTPTLQAWAIRVLAQVTFGRNYRNLSPEGDRLGMATNDDGALSKNGWGSTNEIEKAVRIMKDGSLKNISNNLGNEHKVRNFYNNIVAPNTPYGDATIDTHAVAAAHLMPYGAKATEVGHNFGSKMNGSEVLGISGVYHLYLDAYREAAADRGILPRQMQSITWEAIRLVYPAANKNAASLAKAEKTWQVLTDANARNTLVGGRIPSPVWAGTNDNGESQGNSSVLQKDGGRNVSGGSLLSGVRSTGAGRDGGVNFSIASQSQIDRVNRALGTMNRGPDERLKVYERAKAKFSTLLQNNQQALDNLRAGTVSFRRTQLLQALGELDAILSIFPPDIRGRVGGYTRLASIAPHDVFKDGEKVSEVSGMNGAIISAWMREGLSIGPAGQQTELPPGYTAKENLGTARADRAIADFFKKRIEMIDRELEKTLRREYDEAFRKLLDRTKPKKAKPGEKPKGIGGDIQDLFAVVRDSVEMNATQVAAHIAGLDSMIASGELTAEQEARAQIEAALVALTGDWKNADADRRRTAFMEASRIWNGAYATHSQKIIRQREEREIARAEAIIATGKAGELAGRKSKAIADSGLKGSWKDYILNLLNFDQVVGVLFGENTEVANTIIDKQRQAENAKEDGAQAKMQELEDFFTDLAGGNLLDGERLRYRLTQPSMTVKGIKMSELEALSAAMMWVQEDGRRHMEGEMDEAGRPVGKWHYNQDFVDEILANLSEEALALRSWLTRNYANEYAKINEVYSELNGVNLPQIQLYSPVTVQPVNAPTGQVLDPVSGSAMSGASTSPGALRTRGTAIAEPRFQDVLQTYISHTLQMEHWKAFAPMIAEANGILRNRDVQNSVEEKGGAEARKMLNAWLDYFAQGGTRDAGAHLALNQGLNNVLGRASQVALVGRASTLLIQSTQLGAALAEMPLKAYLKRMGKLLTGQLGWDSALNSDYIQRRVKQMPPVVQLAMQGLKGAKPTAIQQAGKRLGMLLSGADGFFTAGTYAITYDYHLTKAKELGLAGQEAEDYARNTAERVTDRIAQPTRAGARSLYENTSTNPLARAGWAFASEARKNLALVAYSFAERDTATKMRTLAYVVALNAIGSAILRSIWRDILDDEDDELFDDKYWSPKRIATAIATEPLYGFPVLGSVVQEAVYKSFGEYKPSESLFSVQNAIGPIKRLPDHLSGDTDLREVMRDIDMVVSALGIMHPNIAATASITHLAKDLFNLTDSTVDAVTEN